MHLRDEHGRLLHDPVRQAGPHSNGQPATEALRKGGLLARGARTALVGASHALLRRPAARCTMRRAPLPRLTSSLGAPA